MTHTAARKPISEIYHLERNDGRYEGDEPKWFRKEMSQRVP